MRRTKLTAAIAAVIVTTVIATPIQASTRNRLPPSWYDAHGSMLTYNPARGDPGPGNGPVWQGEPTDRESVWRRSHYRGNDPDNRIRQQLMRDR
jgi:hypothetical protein